MLLAVARAASSHALGADDDEAQRTLDGKQFEIRLRFGCDGQGPVTEGHGWSVDPDGRTLRLRVVPNLSLDDEPVASVSAEAIEAAEGFWLSRPWLLYAACPATPEALESAATEAKPETSKDDAQAKPPTGTSRLAAQRIGIAQFFTSEDPRTLRRMNRPFEAVKPLKEGEVVGRQGFNLVLSGRLRSRGDGRVILCVGSGRDRAPDCVVSARIDRVWIERPEDRAVMAEWGT
ncbi:MAG TPA: hypothetical protein VFR36_07810 [Sphingomicrobium sp.]|nr:hypothetical protein [Sphingomicrobium sp.]